MQEITTIPLQTVTPKRKTQLELTDQLIEALFQGHKTFSQACKDLGLSRPRAYRLWNKWKENQEAQLIDTEWWDLYLTVKQENPDKALECLTRLKYRMITQKAEIKQDITAKQIKIVRMWQPNDPATSTARSNPQIHTVSEASPVP